MNKEIVLLFSGQGSQYYGMAKSLFDENPIFRSSLLKQDRIVKEIIGESVIEKVYDANRSPLHVFDQLLYTHPAIFMIQYALFEALIFSGIKPDLLFGMSLGEMVTHAASNSIALCDALNIVVNHARMIEQKCEKALMYAVFENERIIKEHPVLANICHVALNNSARHVVVSLKKSDKKEFVKILKENKVSCVLLPINYGFHSSLIETVENGFVNEMNAYSYSNHEIPVISCLSEDRVLENKGKHFWNIMKSRIDIMNIIKKLEAANDYIYLDASPSGTMLNFVKCNLQPHSKSDLISIITPFGSENTRFDAAIDKLAVGIFGI